ncbi:MAG TPA: hypothetical protein VIC25_02925 [Caulobacteraceae bacterium]
MALSKGDDFPIHQTSDPIAYAGTDRNFYDRYFFNGYPADGDGFFAAAFGVYPHLNIADASVCIVRRGVQTNLHASRWLNMERLDLQVGPIRIEVIEPLRILRLIVDAPEQRLAADIRFEGLAFPLEEPRFIRRQGPRLIMDYTRLTQNGRYSGGFSLDGQRQLVDGWLGTRDRSWGVRPIGIRDAQEAVPPAPPQFFWIWAPCNFPSGGFFFHTNDDGEGRPWNRRAAWCPNGIDRQIEIGDAAIAIDWKPGTRQAGHAVVSWSEGQAGQIVFEPQFEFYMLGLGYGHPKWAHGLAHGPLAVERETFALSEVDRQAPHHLHVQAVSKITWRSDRGETQVGRGTLEQLAIGPHAPSGFTDLIGPARGGGG